MNAFQTKTPRKTPRRSKIKSTRGLFSSPFSPKESTPATVYNLTSQFSPFTQPEAKPSTPLHCQPEFPRISKMFDGFFPEFPTTPFGRENGVNGSLFSTMSAPINTASSSSCFIFGASPTPENRPYCLSSQFNTPARPNSSFEGFGRRSQPSPEPTKMDVFDAPEDDSEPLPPVPIFEGLKFIIQETMQFGVNWD